MKEKGLKGTCEQIIAENFPKLGTETSIPLHEAERIPPNINKNGPTSWHIIMKLANLRAKEAILIAARENRCIMNSGRNIRITADLSTKSPDKPERSGKAYSAYYMRSHNQKYVIPQGCHSEWMERQGPSRTHSN